MESKSFLKARYGIVLSAKKYRIYFLLMSSNDIQQISTFVPLKNGMVAQ